MYNKKMAEDSLDSQEQQMAPERAEALSGVVRLTQRLLTSDFAKTIRYPSKDEPTFIEPSEKGTETFVIVRSPNGPVMLLQGRKQEGLMDIEKGQKYDFVRLHWINSDGGKAGFINFVDTPGQATIETFLVSGSENRIERQMKYDLDEEPEVGIVQFVSRSAYDYGNNGVVVTDFSAEMSTQVLSEIKTDLESSQVNMEYTEIALNYLKQDQHAQELVQPEIGVKIDLPIGESFLL